MATEEQKVIFSMVQVSRTHGQKTVLRDISLGFFFGAKIGVLGLNGAGKSTLLKIMAGVDEPSNGEVVRAPGYTVGLLEQEPELEAGKTVREIVEEGAEEATALLSEFDALAERFSEPLDDDEMQKVLDRQGVVQDKIESMGAWELDSRLELAMDALRCPPGDTKVEILSGGERRRVALCRLLIRQPDILLLDEPTNHLDDLSVAWLERHLKEYAGTVIAVTHDRYFLDNVAGWILELDRGHGIPWKGNYSSWLEQKAERLRQEKRSEGRRQKTLERELEWIRMAPHARHAKGKARINAYQEMLSQEPEKMVRDLEIWIPPGPRLGDVVIETENLAKGHDDRLLFDDLSFSVPPGAIVGVIGGNGAGKTTLFELITGTQEPDSGALRIGETVELGYVDQSRSTLDPEKSVWEVISEGSESIWLGRTEVNSRAYVGQFNFTGSDQQKRVNILSGGERNRVHLARMLKEGANVLLLDEPTNDLDVNTLRALEEAILAFAGCVLVISHDRWFLDRVATHMLAFEGDSHVEWFPGPYSDYIADRRKRLGDTADRPHRVTYRPLTRG
ncbi:MAG: energy-dependent translational throttle protein EttA [Acidobacteria bacterium]|uniref:Energy-dependent translational throttle protein EttA n=1 Tax=Candidatus Sulfomarinibacter kjeldsenii TaxID=2885994 RepID=A0A8J6Y507_9BACT|nr:energy-dependent translational throttle protein EttA [Candidatus Sulfomarinibacter kjeldsenii]MBD3870322.1 energy-dependent translational throttle protein EttA [Candidatus Sulfomarinibacter kjeldsenii]